MGDIELLLINRRRWAMGGTKNHARGLDEDGNSGNCVESEQIVMRHVHKDNMHRLYLSSFV